MKIVGHPSRVILLLLGGLFTTQVAAAQDHNATAIDTLDLRRHVRVLASDALEGRMTGSVGQRMAATYIKATLSGLGLEPANGDSFSQQVPFTRTRFSGVSVRIGDHLLDNFSEVILWESGDPMPLGPMGLVFIGDGSAEYLARDLEGRAVLIIPSGDMGTWRAAAAEALAAGAVATFVANSPSDDFFQNMMVANARALSANGKIELDIAGPADPMAWFVSPSFARLALGMDRDGLAAMSPDEVLAMEPVPIEITARVDRERLVSENIAAVLRSDGPHADEFVVISGHYDHLGNDGGEIFNGANDNASGIAALLEIAEAMAAEQSGRLQRSVMFLAFTAEEVGLLGSEYYAQSPLVSFEETVANLNIDMIGRIDSINSDNPRYVYLIGSDKLSSDLHEWSERANREHVGLALDYRYNDEDDPNQFYYRSDHWNFAQNGVPVIFYHDGDQQVYHVPEDDWDTLDYGLLAERARLVYHTALAILTADSRPEVDIVD